MSNIVNLRMQKDTVDTILEGLDHLPHGRVRNLYDAIATTAREQLYPPEQEKAENVVQLPQRRLVAGRVRKAR